MTQKSTEALFEAIEANDVEKVKELIQAGADVNAKKYGDTPLHCCKNVDVAKLLIEAGADVNAKGYYERTPLHKCENVDVAKLLIEAGADINAKDSDGLTPLYCRDPEIANVIIEAGANLEAEVKRLTENIKAAKDKLRHNLYPYWQLMENVEIGRAHV